MKECQIRPSFSKAFKKITPEWLSGGYMKSQLRQSDYFAVKVTGAMVLVSPKVVWTGEITNCS